MAIPTGYYGKIFPHSGLLNDHFISCDAGVVDADYRGSVLVLLLNHHSEKAFTVRTGNRIAQIVYMKKFDVEFEKVSDPALLGKTKREIGGFESTGSLYEIPLKRVSPVLKGNEIFVISDDSNESDD